MSANFMEEPTNKLTYKLLKQTYKPQFVNINVEFGDSEVFLVDGDALLLHLLNLNKNVSCSSLHLIFLMEVFLYQFIKRSGQFSLIFFSDNEGNWSSTKGQLISKGLFGVIQKNNPEIYLRISALASKKSSNQKSSVGESK